jgi:tRNA A-37 threonylcarbamoyl transferase component Bud32
MWVFCVASDGEQLAVGRVRIINGEVEFDASLENAHWLPLSADRGQAAGLVALHHLLGATDDQLGFHRELAATFDGHRIVTILGLGGFSTVYKCAAAQGGGHFAVKTRAFVHNVTASRVEVAAQLANELHVLQHLNRAGNAITVPVLSEYQSADASWIGLRDIVVRLRGHLHSLNDAQQSAFWPILREDLLSAVRFVHSVGYAHNDLRPDNVAVIMGADGHARAQIIDFGLATPLSNSVFHKHRGGLPYFHDSVVIGHEQRQPVAVTAAQDFASAAYVFYAAVRYSREISRFEVPWGLLKGEELVTERARAMQRDGYTVWEVSENTANT